MLEDVSAITTLTTGERTLEVVTGGQVGAQRIATVVAEHLLESKDLVMVRRVSSWGALTFIFSTKTQKD